jgi:hypothetical protein
MHYHTVQSYFPIKELIGDVLHAMLIQVAVDHETILAKTMKL